MPYAPEQAALGTRAIGLFREKRSPHPATGCSIPPGQSKICHVQVSDSETEQPWAENVLEPGQVLGRARHHSWLGVINTSFPWCGLCLAGLWFMQTLILSLNTHTHLLFARKNHFQAPGPVC